MLPRLANQGNEPYHAARERGGLNVSYMLYTLSGPFDMMQTLAVDQKI